jgi:HlyD family secretion protein
MKTILLITLSLAGLAGVCGRLLLVGMHAPTSEAASQAHLSAASTTVAANGIVEGGRPEAALRFEVGGRLAGLRVRENAQVEAGEVLAELDNAVQKHQVALATAELAHARAELDRVRNGERKEKRQALAAVVNARRVLHEHAKADWERSQRLADRRAVSQEQWDQNHFNMLRTEAEWRQAKAEQALVEAPARVEDLAAAEARVAAAQARLELAEAELAKTRLRSPSSGVVLQVLCEPGEAAGPSSAQPVLVLADLSRRRVRAFIEELDAGRVQSGQRVVVTADGFPGQEYNGQVSVVLARMGKRAPHSDEPGEYRDVYYREVLIDLDSAHELPLNLRVHVRIRIDEK